MIEPTLITLQHRHARHLGVENYPDATLMPNGTLTLMLASGVQVGFADPASALLWLEQARQAIILRATADQQPSPHPTTSDGQPAAISQWPVVLEPPERQPRDRPVPCRDPFQRGDRHTTMDIDRVCPTCRISAGMKPSLVAW